MSRVSIDGNVISVLFSGNKEEEADLLNQLIGAGVMLTSFGREHGSLESVFFAMTEAEKEVKIYEPEIYESESGFSD